jgi:hypothetical protein
MSDKNYFLYGSGRDASTRSVRRRTFPREITPRVGPFIVRPGKSYGPLTAEQLAGYERQVIEKVQAGTVQVYLGNDRLLALGDLQKLFSAIRGTPEVVNYEGMDLAALHAFTRDHQQDSQAWYWLVVRLVEAEQIASASSAIAHATSLGVTFDEEQTQALDALFSAASEKIRTQQPEQVDQRKVETEPAPADEPVAEQEAAPAEPAPVPEEPKVEELKDATAPAEVSPDVVEQPTPEPTELKEAEPAPAARTLPDGWKDLSNKKLAELIKSVGAEMPSKTDKGSLIASLDAWVKG